MVGKSAVPARPELSKYYYPRMPQPIVSGKYYMEALDRGTIPRGRRQSPQRATWAAPPHGVKTRWLSCVKCFSVDAAEPAKKLLHLL